MATLTVFSFLTSCSSDENTTTTDDPVVTTSAQTVQDNFEVLASQSIPLVVTTSGGSSLKKLNIESSTVWDDYISGGHEDYLEEIFGDPDQGFAVVTKIRVLLDQFNSTLESILSQDPDITCEGTTAFGNPDSVELAFFGTITPDATDAYDCIYSDASETLIYGRDSQGAIHVTSQSDTESENTEDVGTRGDTKQIKQVVNMVYTQTSTESTTQAYLEMNYAQATLYNGADDSFDDADDNMVFASRTQLVGTGTIATDGSLENPVANFKVTKFDRTPGVGGATEIMTKVFGRGSMASDGAFLFTIDSNAGSLPGEDQTFCLTPTDTLPSATDETDCDAYADNLPWSSFEFDLAESIDANYTGFEFYEDSDLISSSGENFEIPSY